MPIRISGMNSGLDTEALVSELVSAYQKKTDKYVKAQTKVSWKQEAWKTMSAKTYSFRKSLDSLRFSSAYNLKTTSVSNSSKASITASNKAVNGTQTLKITSLAKSGYLTGGRLDKNGSKATESSTLADLGFSGSGSVSLNGKEITLSGKTTIKEALAEFKDAGVDANFDETNQRIFISAKESGASNDFTLSATNQNGATALKKLGLYVESGTANATYEKLDEKYGSILELKDQEAQAELSALLENYNKNTEKVKDADDALAHLEKAQEYIKAKNTVASADAGLTSLLDDKTRLINAESGITYTYHTDETTGEKYYTDDTEPVGEGEKTRYYLTEETTTTSQEKKDERGETVVDADDNPVMEDVTTTTRYLKAKDSEVRIDVQTADEYLQGAGGMDADSISDYRAAQTKIKNIQAEADAEDAASIEGEFTDDRSLKSLIEKVDDKSLSEDDINDKKSVIVSEKNTAQAALDADHLLADYAKKYAAADDKTKELLVEQLQSEIAYASSMVDPDTKPDYTSDAVRIDGEDATIVLNNATFTSNTNSFSINGLTINAMAITDPGETLTITTSTDNQGIYDKIKDFLSEYNSLINSMTSSYNAENTNAYEPLTSDEKDSMSETEIEKWEEKGKSGILRRDTTLSTLMSAMTSVMSKSYTIDGKTYALSSFGIKTLGIMNAGKNEHNAFHIDGDADDESTSSNEDKLMAAIATDPDGVAKFFQKLSSDLYDKLGENMTSTSLRSYGTFYNDKEMAKEYSDYTKTISKWEDRVADIEDSYYKKFAAMESALAKLQSQTSQLSGLLGM